MTTTNMTIDVSARELAQKLLRAVRAQSTYDGLMQQLCALSDRGLQRELNDDAKKHAFWLNVYNALGQVSILATSVDLSDSSVRSKHYARRDLCIAGHSLSLNDIEHGMLRHSKIWWSAGYLSKWFPGEFETSMRVPLDPRIHFALNCGAASCPPILYYDADKLDKQLDIAAHAYLAPEVAFDAANNVVTVSKLFQWYAGDFGGTRGVLSFLRHFRLIPPDAHPRIAYKPYDWTVQLHNFADN